MVSSRRTEPVEGLDYTVEVVTVYDPVRKAELDRWYQERIERVIDRLLAEQAAQERSA